MGQMLFMYFLPLTLGIAFAVVGWLAFIGKLRSRGETEGTPHTSGLLFVLIGSVLALTILFGTPPPWTRMRMINRVLHPPADRVHRIELSPASYESLIHKKVEIAAPADVQRFLMALGDAEGYEPNHPRAKWNVGLAVITDEGTAICEVSQLLNDGTMLYFGTNPTGNGGWRMGTYRCDDVGFAIENYLRDHPQP